MRNKPDPTQWKNVTTDQAYGLGNVWQRFTLLAEHDPYVSFFTERTIMAIANVVCRAIGDKDQSHMTVETSSRLTEKAVAALCESPLMNLTTPQFKLHIAEMFVTAAFPQGDPA